MSNFEYSPIGGNEGMIPQGTTIKTTLEGNAHIQHVKVDSTTDAPTYITPTGDGWVSLVNSSTDNLAGNAAFEGAFEDVREYGGIRVSVYSSHASATGGLQMWCSKDGTNGFAEDSYTIPAGTPKTFAVPVAAPFFKVRFVNGATPTTDFNLCVMYQRNVSIPSSHRIGDTITDEDDAQLVKSVLSARKPNGTQTNIDATAGGNLKVSLEEIETAVIVPTTRADDLYNDAFQWYRVSQKNKRFDFDFHAGENPFLWDYVGNGTVTFSTDSRDVVIAITGTATSDTERIIQHYYNIYTPFYSQVAAGTGVLNGANLAGSARAFLRSSVTGVVTEEYVNITTTDIDFSDSQIFVLDFQSLRVGRARFALDRGGQLVEIGEITNDNERATGYWQTANLPIMYRVYNTTDNTIAEICYGDENNGLGYQFVSALDASQTVRAICAGVASEGGGNVLDLDGFPFFAPPVTAPIVAAKSVSTTLIPLVSIKVSDTLYGLTNRELVVPTAYTLQTSNPIEYVILYRPTLTGASWVATSTDSGVEYDITASAVSGGTQIDGDFLSSGTNQVALSRNVLGKTIMALGNTGTADIITIAAIRTGTADATVRSKLKWKEIR